jgi:hypothetical protein
MATPNLKLVRPPDEAAQQDTHRTAQAATPYVRFKHEAQEEILREGAFLVKLLVHCVGTVVILALVFGSLYAKDLVKKIWGDGGHSAAVRSGGEFVAKRGVNIRGGPGEGHGIIGGCQRGDRVRLLGMETNGTTVWFKVELLGGTPKGEAAQVGWVSAQFFDAL